MDIVQINIPKELFTELVMDGILKEDWLTEKYKNIEIFDGDDIHFNLLSKKTKSIKRIRRIRKKQN